MVEKSVKDPHVQVTPKGHASMKPGVGMSFNEGCGMRDSTARSIEPGSRHHRTQWKSQNRSRYRRTKFLYLKPKFFRAWQKKANKNILRSLRYKNYKKIRKYLLPYPSFSLDQHLKDKGNLYRMKFSEYYRVFGKYYGKSLHIPQVSLFFGYRRHDFWEDRLRRNKRIYFSYKGVPNRQFGPKYKADVYLKEHSVFRWRIHNILSPYIARGYRYQLRTVLRKYNSTLNTFSESKRKYKKLSLYTFYPRTSKRHFRSIKSYGAMRYLQYSYFRRHRKFAKMRSLDRNMYFLKRLSSDERGILQDYFLKRTRRPLANFKIRKLFYRGFIEPKKIYKRFNKRIKKISRKAAGNIFKRRSRLPFRSRKVFRQALKYKRLNSFPIKFRIRKLIRKRIWHKKQVKLDRAYRMVYNKPHHRKKVYVDNRWDFLLEKAFKNYYSIRYSLFTMFYSRSVAEVNQQINYGRFSINGHFPKNETYLSRGDIVCDLYKNDDFDLESSMEDIKTRKMFYPFLELDDYIQNISVVKDVEFLSNSDTLLMNLATTRFANVNFLRR